MERKIWTNNRVHRRVFGLKRKEVEDRRDCLIGGFIHYTLQEMLLGCSNQGG
jgi:hypothetical protein